MSAAIICATLQWLVVQTPAVAVSVTGAVEVDTGAGLVGLRRFDDVAQSSRVLTHDASATELRMPSGSLMRLSENTDILVETLNVDSPVAKRETTIRLTAGRLWARVTKLLGEGSRFEVQSRATVAGVRGTSFFVEASAGSTRFVLIEGALELLREQATVRLDKPGAFAEVGEGGIGAPGILEPAVLDRLRSELLGPGHRLAGELRLQSTDVAEPGGNKRARQRRKLRSPTRFTDTVVSEPGPVEESGG